jgi:hypothetical protein
MNKDLIILKRCVKKGLETEVNNSSFRFRVTMSGYLSIINPIENFIINIDNYKLKVYTYPTYKRGYLQYFYYVSNETFPNGNIIKYDLYLPVDEVLDGFNFFTSTKIERRKLKIIQLKEKIKKNLLNNLAV